MKKIVALAVICGFCSLGCGEGTSSGTGKPITAPVMHKDTKPGTDKMVEPKKDEPKK